MFGYILPEKPEMKIKEYELFRAYYCGVCKAIGSRCGQLPRFLLNYDSTFLAILLASVTREKPAIRHENCIAHPLKKRHIVKNSSVVDYASDMNILLAYYNLKDHWTDERSVISGTGMLALGRCVKKLKREYPQKSAAIQRRLDELSKLEAEKCASMDLAAEPFARLMQAVLNPCDMEGAGDTANGTAEHVMGDMAHGSVPVRENEQHKIPLESGDSEALRWIGYNMGRWIYILDAYDDLERDVKKKVYNVLLYQFRYSGENVDAFKEIIRERVEFALTYSLDQIAKAYALMKTSGCSAIAENIIYMGMLRKTEQILRAGSCRKVDESV